MTHRTCCVVGAGPAGLMLGLMLARAGVDVTVLEKHGDFLRDFRGDTVHPSTLEVMHELGLLDGLLKLPHTQAPSCTPRSTAKTSPSRTSHACRRGVALSHSCRNGIFSIM